MEKEIIRRLRYDKNKLLKLYNLIKSEIDFDVEMLDSKALLILSIISKIKEDLEDIIYNINED